MLTAPVLRGLFFEARDMQKIITVSKPLSMALLATQFALSALAIDLDTESKAASDTYQDVARNVDPQTAERGLALWAENCARCHDTNVSRAPQRFILEQLGPRSILTAMINGPMREVAAHLSYDGKKAIAEGLTGRQLTAVDSMAAGKMCEGPAAEFDRDSPPALQNWGFDAASTHYIGPDVAQVTAKDLNALEVEWAFAYPAATRARSQPAVAAGAIFTGSHEGIVYAFDLETGCARWKFNAGSEVRNAIVIEDWEAGDENANPKIFFGNLTGHEYAVEAFTGKLVWSRLMDEHPAVTLTAASALVDDTLYVPMSSLEEAAAINPAYPCCTFRGAVAALDPATGEERWRTHFIPPAEPVGENSVGTPRFGPAGVPVWAGLAFDGDLMLVGTGDDYTSPSTDRSDAIVAINRHSGEIVWTHQTYQGDSWNASCEEVDKINCPEDYGPDWDYGAGPLVTTGKSGRKVVVAGDKGSTVVGIDIKTGKTLWRNKVGRGGVVSGINFGIAAHNGIAYIPISDVPDGRSYERPANPGLFALDVDTGEFVWRAPSMADTCKSRPGCYPGYSAAVTVTDEYVLAGSNDGYLRAFHPTTGEVLWSYDTTQPVTAVDGAEAKGGAVGGGQSPLVIGDRISFNSGYAFAGKMPGNALLVLKPRAQ